MFELESFLFEQNTNIRHMIKLISPILKKVVSNHAKFLKKIFESFLKPLRLPQVSREKRNNFKSFLKPLRLLQVSREKRHSKKAAYWGYTEEGYFLAVGPHSSRFYTIR